MQRLPTAPSAKKLPVDQRVRRYKVPTEPVDGDTTVQRHLDSISDSTDSALAFLNSSFQLAPIPTKLSASQTPTQVAAQGTPPLMTNGAIVAGGPLTSNGTLTVNGPATISGNETVGGSLGVAQGGTFGGPLVCTTLSAPGSSFRCVTGPWAYSSGSYPGGIISLGVYGGAIMLPSSQFGFVMPFAGSIVAINGVQQFGANNTFQAYYFINGSSFLISSGAVSTGQNTTWGMTYLKGQIPVAAGAVLGLGAGYNTTGIASYVAGHIVVEMAP